jgi:hypothetical protein
MYTAESSVSEHLLRLRLQLKSYKSPGVDQISAELIQVDSNTFLLSYANLIVLRIMKISQSSGKSLLL